MMTDEKKETTKFKNKDEISRAISVLTPFTPAGNPNIKAEDYPFAIDKVKELVKLL